MSRIGKKPITIPDKVTVNYQDNLLMAIGPKGELSIEIPKDIELFREDNVITLNRKNEEKRIRSLHGLTRSLAANIIEGVNVGFTKTLQLEGVGYKVEMKGNRLMLSLGFSHQILVIPPEGIEFEVPKTPANTFYIRGIEKQVVGEIAAKIRSFRPPEPYKGKGVRYAGEYIRRKPGKTAAK